MNRRNFLKMASGSGMLAGLGDLSFLGKLPVVSAAETQLAPPLVRLDPETEPLVRLIERTPRERVLEDYHFMQPPWSNRYLAASVFNLKGSRDKDNDLVKRARAALM